MTWGAAAILVGGLLALGGVAAWLIHRAYRRAEDAETAAAVARAKSLNLQAKEARERAMGKLRVMTDEQIVAKADAIADQIRKDQGR